MIRSSPTRDAYLTLDMEQVQGRLALRYFSDSLNPNLVKFYYICLSTVTTSEFYRQLCVKLGLEVSYKKTIMFQRIQDYFYSMSMNKNVHCMVCLDEAQYLNGDILKDLKILCNFCMDSKNKHYFHKFPRMGLLKTSHLPTANYALTYNAVQPSLSKTPDLIVVVKHFCNTCG